MKVKCDHREKSQWTRKRKMKFYEMKISKLDKLITDKGNEREKYIERLREVRYRK